jgi:hypothetical protein
MRGGFEHLRDLIPVLFDVFFAEIAKPFYFHTTSFQSL